MENKTFVESNLRICKKCKVLKTRTQAGTWNGKDKKWVDESGLVWNGSHCPSCTAERVRAAMKQRREKK